MKRADDALHRCSRSTPALIARARHSRWATFFLSLATGAAALALWPTTALPRDGGEDVSSDRLETLEKDLGERRAAAQEQRDRAEALAAETAALRRRTIEAAAVVQAREARLLEIEERLQGLLVEEELLIEELNARREDLGAVLAALQSVERNKPPALVVRPDDAVDAARSAVLLGAVYPGLRAKAEALAKRLEDLKLLREEITSERERIAEQSDALEEERRQLDDLLARKEEERFARAVAAAFHNSQMARVAARTKDLRALIEALESRAMARLPRLRPDAAMAAVVPTPSVRPRMPDLLRRPPDPEFDRGPGIAAAKGRLRLPAVGRVVAEFGESDGSGGRTRGIRIATRAGAQVVAPFDGQISYAAPYRGYGQLLIITANDGYHLVLAGLDYIDGVVDQELLAGEPIGVMGRGTPLTPTLISTGTSGPDNAEEIDGPELYLELRRGAEPIDPLSWFIVERREVGG